MRLVDLYFRTFNAYKNSVLKNSEEKKFRQAIKRANKKNESITITKYICDIEEDWIENIEDGLIYIEKALNEARQFIRTEGEVVRIEKVKKTSKASIKHLSRNSNLISRKAKNGGMIIPDKLYIVEKLSDYAVYENRFLLLLLTYLRDFIYTRLEKIKTKTTTYHSEMNVDKQIDISSRHIDYQLEVKDTYLNDPYLMEKYLANPIAERMEKIYYSVDAFLQTPLMKEVAKAPMLSLPIVKTNVLRMNPNFRAALNLYDYIMAYNKLGYKLKENKKTYNPFIDDMSDEIAEVIELTTFISYKFGNEITDDLKRVFEKDEKKIAEEKQKKKKETLEKLKTRLKENNIGLEDYVLILEERNIELEKENAKINQIKELNLDYEKQIKQQEIDKEELVLKIDGLNQKINNRLEEIQTMKNKYFKDMSEAEKVHQDEKQQLTRKYESKIEDINNTHQEEVNDLIEQHKIFVSQLRDKHDSKISELTNQFEIEKNEIINESELLKDDLKDQIRVLNIELEEISESKKQLINDYDETINDLNDKIDNLTTKKDSIKGRYYAIKQKHGLLTDKDNFTSKDRFKELEEIKRAFNQFFKEQWRETKAKIRANVKEKSEKMLEEDKLSKQDDKENNQQNN